MMCGSSRSRQWSGDDGLHTPFSQGRGGSGQGNRARSSTSFRPKPTSLGVVFSPVESPYQQ